MTIIEKNRDKIIALCDKHRVARLFVFGSVLTDNFKKNSDIDLLVDFSGVELYDYAENYFSFKKSLERLLKRQIDLLEDKAVKNPYLRRSIDSSKTMIYG
ncbi:MAG: nucleotidyltransferase domain-containing protein [Bacteroidales bacterium]|nr:nucleotidyltransferase domain-containing protein [Bacteroidales bacterium]